MSRLKTLIVEDEAISRRILRAMLDPLGVCEEVEDGLDAVHAFKTALGNGEPYSLVLLDIMMPNLDGHKALKEIRLVEDQYGIDPEVRCPVVMVTALHEQHHILKAYMRGGATGYLVKPVDKGRLLNEIKKLGLIV